MTTKIIERSLRESYSMLKEEPLHGEISHPELLRPRSRPADALIRARESLLNRLVVVRPSLVINGGLPEVDMAAPDDLAARLKQTLLALKASVMDETGRKVDYVALRDSPAYTAYREGYLSVLRHYQPGKLLSLPARRAFWINLYNALVLDLLIRYLPDDERRHLLIEAGDQLRLQYTGYDWVLNSV